MDCVLFATSLLLINSFYSCQKPQICVFPYENKMSRQEVVMIK